MKHLCTQSKDELGQCASSMLHSLPWTRRYLGYLRLRSTTRECSLERASSSVYDVAQLLLTDIAEVFDNFRIYFDLNVTHGITEWKKKSNHKSRPPVEARG